MDILERQGSRLRWPSRAGLRQLQRRAGRKCSTCFTDQNGSVYFIDWYDKNQCHHNNVEGHDRTNGRIFKLVYNDEKWTPVDLQKKTNDELIELLAHKNQWYARHAQRILLERLR